MTLSPEQITQASPEQLAEWVADSVSIGCADKSKSLGFAEMPEGYALMLNPDQTHYFWLRFDGKESPICWDKWAVYRGAKKNKACLLSEVEK